MKTKLLLILGTALTLSACSTTPEPIEETEIEIDIEPVQTCVPLEMLTKVEIPAVTQKRMTIVLIDNPPYDPIEKVEEREVIIEDARTAYVDAEGQEVIDICDINDSAEREIVEDETAG